MALSVTARGTSANTSATTSQNFTTATTIPAGSAGVLVIAADNAGSGGATTVFPASVVDTVGNTWTRRINPIYDPGPANAGVDLAAYTCEQLSTNLTNGDSVTIAWAAGVTVAAKAYAFWEITPGAGNTLSYITGAAGTGSATGTPTITTGSITSGDAVIGFGGAETGSSFTADADTTNGSWSTQQSSAAGTTTSGMSVASQVKIVTGTATQTYNPTLTSADVILGWIQMREVDGAIYTPYSGSAGYYP
jgi:hypothetical protein